MSLGDVWSHKGKKLERHLIQVEDLATVIANNFGIDLVTEERRSILLHDIAKAHPRFQIHLLKKRVRFGHAAPSAALVLAETQDLLYAEAVRRHHSHLEDLEAVKSFWSCWDYKENMSEAINPIPVWDGAEPVKQRLGTSAKTWSELLPGPDEWEDMIFDAIECYPRNEVPLELEWLRLRLFYSLLITADRFDAAVDGMIEYPPLLTDLKLVQEYVDSLHGKPLAEWRGQVRKEVIGRAAERLQKPGVYTLTLPTGAGKTLIGLEVAMRSVERLNATGIIYVLPFISLVEQNADVARDLFASVQEDHHLSQIIDVNSENLTPQERFLSFFRYWYEPVVVTTMAKLWEVLYSPKGNDTMPFHRLSRAIVILDEPQTIKSSLWDGFGRTMQLLAERLDTTFILMTATQPEITKGEELAPRAYQFPHERHRFIWLPEKKNVPEMLDELEQQGLRKNSSLLVFNTRKEALLAYGELLQRGISPYFLSSWVTPFDRATILQQLKEDEKFKSLRWLVATQVVEAGVDLDFQLAFRDLGPLDSIIQVAGRCNRHGSPDMGKVIICELQDENGKSFAGYVYESTLIVATRSIMKASFTERECSELVVAYYRKVRELIAPDELWNDIKSGKWGKQQHLIEKRRPDEALLVVYYQGVEDDLEIINREPEPEEEYMKLVEQKRATFRRIGIHSVSVPQKMLEEWSSRTGGMIYDSECEQELKEVLPGVYLVQEKGIGRIYSHTIGFIPSEMDYLTELAHDGK